MYTPLNIKTNNTLLSSLIKIDDLIEFAIKNNLKSLTITDNNMYGVMEFYHKCLNNNIKPIVGLDAIIDKYNIILYCMNYNGYKNLLRLATQMSENAINFEVLKKYSNDLICIVPYNSNSIINEIEKIYKIVFKSYKNSSERKLLMGDNLVYMNEILYLEEKNSIYLNYLIAIRDRLTIKEVTTKYNNHLFLDINTDLENNQKICDLCNLEIVFNKNMIPKYTVEDSFAYLKDLCKEGLIRIFGKTVKKAYLDRLKYELDVINKMGFNDYFLIVYDYVKFAKDNDILVSPGRGSAAGSLVSYLLNITTIDPLKYDLLFERFLNPERISMPDIDMDFDSERREEVIKYCIQKYGSKRVAPIITFSTLKSRQVIKDVARVTMIDSKTVDILCNMLDRNLSLSDNYKLDKVKNYLNINRELLNIYKIALQLEDLKRQTSIHAAGVVMSNVDLEEVIPLEKHDTMYLTGYSMEYLEELGLIKMDFLGISFLTLISDILKDIEKIYNKKLRFDDIPMDDNNVYEIFKNANTLGIFQFESNGMMNFLRKLKPDSFDDIIAAIALYRPGPMSNIDSYIKRKQGKEKIEYIVPELEETLKPTYGIIIYQEQIMQIASIIAGYTLGEADVLRKAMSKKKEDILLKEKDKFISGCMKNGILEYKAIAIYELILKFASYGFNKSHSVAYSVVAYKMAYLKLYYRKVFLKNLLTRFINSPEKTKEYIYECKKNNVSILKPDINLSTNTYNIEENGIRFPLLNIKNIGMNAVNTILEERKKGLFKDIFDFAQRVYGKSVNKKTLECLIDSGSFDSFGLTKKTLKENIDIIINYSELGGILNNDESLKPVLNMEEEYSKQELIKNELETFGFYLSEHPVTSYKLKEKCMDLNRIEEYFNKKIVTIVYIDKIKEVVTKDNEKMMFIIGSDEMATADIVAFPRVCKRVDVKVGDVIRIEGKVEKRFDKYQILVYDIINYH
ncbi:MAG: DNA polymerase III subunit alpha [Firmicutes bacterium]|nr:DNA polymerase III subunit alpha [Bacillota bacterium]